MTPAAAMEEASVIAPLVALVVETVVATTSNGTFIAALYHNAALFG